MIFDAIVGFFVWLLELILSALPDIDAPDWLDVSGPMGTVFALGGALGNWVPMGLIGIVLLAIVATWGIAFTIKIARIVASFFTAGGGSAA